MLWYKWSMGTPEEGEEGLFMDIITGRDGDVDNWKEVILIYSSALKQIGTKLEILNDEFQHVHSYNPIEHIKSRIKTSESIVKKLRRYGYESTISNMVEYAWSVRSCLIFTVLPIWSVTRETLRWFRWRTIWRIRSRAAIAVIIWLWRFRYICQTGLWIRRWRFRSGQ
mgnify:CR=1 FL=1